MRVDITRHGIPVQALAMPVVLELRASTLVRYHKYRHDVFVVPGEQGKLHPGVRVAKVHFHWPLVQNLWRLSISDPAPGPGLPNSGDTCAAQTVPPNPEKALHRLYGIQVLCSQGNRSFRGCGQVMSIDALGRRRPVRDFYGDVAEPSTVWDDCDENAWFHRSGKGYWYCAKCLKIVQGKSRLQ